MKSKPFYKSKKFWAVISGCAVVFGKEVLGLDESSVLSLVGLISSYAIGQGIADAKSVS